MLKIPRWYLYLALAYAVLGILDTLIILKTYFFMPFFILLNIVWVLFNAFLLIYFKDNYEKSALVLPTYYIGFFFLAYILLMMIRSVKFGIGLQLGSSLVELALVIYFLKRIPKRKR